MNEYEEAVAEFTKKIVNDPLKEALIDIISGDLKTNVGEDIQDLYVYGAKIQDNHLVITICGSQILADVINQARLNVNMTRGKLEKIDRHIISFLAEQVKELEVMLKKCLPGFLKRYRQGEFTDPKVIDSDLFGNEVYVNLHYVFPDKISFDDIVTMKENYNIYR